MLPIVEVVTKGARRNESQNHHQSRAARYPNSPGLASGNLDGATESNGRTIRRILTLPIVEAIAKGARRNESQNHHQSRATGYPDYSGLASGNLDKGFGIKSSVL